MPGEDPCGNHRDGDEYGVCSEVVKVTFPEGDKDQFIRVLRWALEDHDSGGSISNDTPGTIEFREIK